MARIAGVNVPENKHLEIALTHIYGIGKKTAQEICLSVKLDYSNKIADLSEDQVEKIRTAVAKFTVEDFMSQVQSHMMSSQYSSLLKKANLKNYKR